MSSIPLLPPLFTSLNPLLSPLPSPSPRFLYFNLYPQGICLQLAGPNTALWEVQITARVVAMWLLQTIWSSSLFCQKLKENLFKTFLACSLIFRARLVKVSCEFEFHLFSQSGLKGAFQRFRCQCQFTSHRKYYSAKDNSCLISSVAWEEQCQV